MRHAYLLIAHNDFELLSNLVKTIDDRRNDIYIHIDKKVKTLPIIDTQNSNVYILKNRIDARWGDYRVPVCGSEKKSYDSWTYAGIFICINP